MWAYGVIVATLLGVITYVAVTALLVEAVTPSR